MLFQRVWNCLKLASVVAEVCNMLHFIRQRIAHEFALGRMIFSIVFLSSVMLASVDAMFGPMLILVPSQRLSELRQMPSRVNVQASGTLSSSFVF